MKYSYFSLLALSLGISACAGDRATISEPVVTVVAVSAPQAELAIGEALQLTATASDAAGRPVTVAQTNWSVSDSSIAHLAAGGVLIGRAPGTVTVTAAVGASSGTINLTVLSARFDTVQYGVDVSPGVRGAMRAFVSSIDSVDATVRGGVRVPADTVSTTIFAVNAAGEPVLGAATYGSTGSNIELSARSTGRMLVESVLFSPLSGIAHDAARAASQNIEAHPSFPSVVAAVRAAAEAGQSYMDSEAALTFAGRIAVDIATGLPHPPQPASLQAPVLPVEVLDAAGGPDYLIKNRGFYPFAISAYRENGDRFAETVVAAREIQITSFPWKFGGTTEATLTGRDGEVRITIGQNDATRKEIVFAVVSDVITSIYQVIGLSASDDITSLTAEIVGSMTPAQVEAIIAAPARQSLLLAFNLVWSQRNLIVDWMVARAGGKLSRFYIALGVRQALGVLSKAEAVAFFVERSPFYVDWGRYNGKSDELFVCQLSGEFINCMAGQYEFVLDFTAIYRGTTLRCSFYGTAEIRRTGNTYSGISHGEEQEGCFGTYPFFSNSDHESSIQFNPEGIELSVSTEGNSVHLEFVWFHDCGAAFTCVESGLKSSSA